jgi:uncharacterized protein YjiK
VIVFALIACGCAQAAPPALGAPRLIETHPLTISEPSDLAIDETGKILWTVTNKPAKVYQLDLAGNVVKTLKYVGRDLEGIAYDPADHTLWVTEERTREIVHLNLEGEVLKTYALDLVGKPNSGPEGICLDDRGRMFLLNEKEPGLFIELNRDLSIATKNPLGFAIDYSGLTYGRKAGGFWIVSDQSQKLFFWTKAKGVVSECALPFPKPEGVAVDEAAKRIYIVSDSENKLYVYRM